VITIELYYNLSHVMSCGIAVGCGLLCTVCIWVLYIREGMVFLLVVASVGQGGCYEGGGAGVLWLVGFL
jgi:hypothetical protein